MGILVGKNLEESRSLLVYENLEGSRSLSVYQVSGSRGSQYRVEREREIIYIFYCTCINPASLQREYYLVFVCIESIYFPQWYYSVA